MSDQSGPSAPMNRSQQLLPALEAAAERTGAQAGATVRAFWGAHQRFFRQLCVGFKVPALVAEVRAALGSGCCVVVGLQSTGEAALELSLIHI